jgi:hypothetical protein
MGTKQKCGNCKGKLGIVNYDCKCDTSKRFCGKCRLPEIHNCTFDFKTESIKRLQKQLVKVDHEKIIKI